MFNRSVPYILTIAIGLILGFCAYHFLMPVPTKLVENTRTVSIIDTVFAKGKDSIVYRTRWRESDSKGAYNGAMLDTLILDTNYRARLHIDSTDWSLNIVTFDTELIKIRVDTLKIREIDSIYVKIPFEEIPWYKTYTFGVASGAAITTGILYLLRK